MSRPCLISVGSPNQISLQGFVGVQGPLMKGKFHTTVRGKTCWSGMVPVLNTSSSSYYLVASESPSLCEWSPLGAHFSCQLASGLLLEMVTPSESLSDQIRSSTNYMCM